MKKTTLLLQFILITFIGFGQSNDLPDRSAFKLMIAVNDTNFYQADVKASPYMLPNNTIQLYPGEKIYVEVEFDQKGIKSMKTVKENINPEKTLTISFSQQTEGKIHQGMTLEIRNPFNKNLEYKANMFLMKYNKWAPTNVYPVIAKLTAFETWSDLIITIGLSGWTFK